MGGRALPGSCGQSLPVHPAPDHPFHLRDPCGMLVEGLPVTETLAWFNLSESTG